MCKSTHDTGEHPQNRYSEQQHCKQCCQGKLFPKITYRFLAKNSPATVHSLVFAHFFVLDFFSNAAVGYTSQTDYVALGVLKAI